MGTKAVPDEFDCYEAAEDDEPIFVLRANDPLAPDIVDEWAKRYSKGKWTAQDEQLTPRQIDKWIAANECARLMREWQKARAG